MKQVKIANWIAAFAITFSLVPTAGWATRAYGGQVSGEITAVPVSGEIEVAHHIYHIKANSAAAKALSSFYAGQNVSLILDGPPGNNNSQVVFISAPSGL